MSPDEAVKPKLNTPNWRALLDMLVRCIEVKDPYTVGHSARVRRYAVKLCRRLARRDSKTWDAYALSCAKIAAYLHDIGKINIDGSILRNRDALTAEEVSQLRSHPALGKKMLQELYAEDITDPVFYHHVRWDGKTDGEYPGYPEGLSGTEIPAIARVIKICDVFDAMTTKRSYNQPVSKEEAAQRILAGAGTQFDPDMAKIFVEEVIPKL